MNPKFRSLSFGFTDPRGQHWILVFHASWLVGSERANPHPAASERSTPFGFLITGISGSPSANWGMSDTHARQPGRVIDFLPACLRGSDRRPFILEPCPRRLAVPRLLSLITQHWRQHTDCTAHTAVRLPSLPGPDRCLDRTLRRTQGHHRLSGADQLAEGQAKPEERRESPPGRGRGRPDVTQ